MILKAYDKTCIIYMHYTFQNADLWSRVPPLSCLEVLERRTDYQKTIASQLKLTTTK